MHSFCDPRTLGRKTLSVNLSDIAAMGGIPRIFLLSIAMPREFDLDFLDRFAEGLFEAAAEHGVTLVGGDTCSSLSGLVLSVTLFGEQAQERVVTRGGARPGDDIYVTGTLGDSALGLALLRLGERKGSQIGRHLDPTPRMVAGRALAEEGIATAMIDVSDGFVSDLGHVLDLSGAGAEVCVADLPLSPDYQARAEELFSDPLQPALAGGEDYELLFTAPPEKAPAIGLLSDRIGLRITRVGRVTANRGLVLTTGDGTAFEWGAGGFDHFARD